MCNGVVCHSRKDRGTDFNTLHARLHQQGDKLGGVHVRSHLFGLPLLERLHRRGNVRRYGVGAQCAALLRVVGHVDVVRDGLRRGDGHMVRQRAHRVGVQNVQNLFQDFFPRQFAARQQNAHVYFSRLRGRCFHVCDQRRRGFCEILIPAQRSRRRIGFHTLTHTLIECRVAFPVCSPCALRYVLDAFVVRENVYRLVDLSGDKSVSVFALYLALRFHAPGPLSRRNCQVLQRSEHDFTVRRGPRACRNGRCHFQRDRKRILQGRSGLFRLQPLRALEQFRE